MPAQGLEVGVRGTPEEVWGFLLLKARGEWTLMNQMTHGHPNPASSGQATSQPVVPVISMIFPLSIAS